MSVQHIKKLEQGKQGITGLVSIDGKVYVYKISQFMNYLTDHEYLILKGLNETSAYCPHFCKLLRKESFLYIQILEMKTKIHLRNAINQYS